LSRTEINVEMVDVDIKLLLLDEVVGATDNVLILVETP
jgi:hypothetical protein